MMIYLLSIIYYLLSIIYYNLIANTSTVGDLLAFPTLESALITWT
jgi:hypothetical protein